MIFNIRNKVQFEPSERLGLCFSLYYFHCYVMYVLTFNEIDPSEKVPNLIINNSLQCFHQNVNIHNYVRYTKLKLKILIE